MKWRQPPLARSAWILPLVWVAYRADASGADETVRLIRDAGGDAFAHQVDQSQEAEVRALVERHGVETESAVAARLLEHWDTEVLEFVKVMPRDYKKARLDQRAEAQAAATVAAE